MENPWPRPQVVEKWPKSRSQPGSHSWKDDLVPLFVIVAAGFAGFLWYQYQSYVFEEKERERKKPLYLTRAQLSAFDGSNPEMPIYVAIQGRIYNVGMSNAFYGSEGEYSVYAGREANRALAKSSTSLDDLVEDTTGLSTDELENLGHWVEFMSHKYPCIGFVIDDCASKGPAKPVIN